ncbi:transforming growth factor-beta-induced protein ig-h3 isoform X2 [Hydra vulgaris]|uniref:transforming growth factor-beta-induced protein ig-h3 isoform X2 n=1 Tax=Hydra vulgaris TaxID=6087 RepID=UPI001F5F97FD|nr:transforming growth factor-beta-induced protein ig-h3 isoform X2 [Hydra vulgaris]
MGQKGVLYKKCCVLKRGYQLKVTNRYTRGLGYAIKRVFDGESRSLEPEKNLSGLKSLPSQNNYSEFYSTKVKKKSKNGSSNAVQQISSKIIAKGATDVDDKSTYEIISKPKVVLMKNSIASLLDPIKNDDSPVDTLSKLGLTSFLDLMLDRDSFVNLYLKAKIVTIFAPTNAAFRSLSKEEKVMLLFQSKLTDIASYHICPGIYTVDQLHSNNIPTLNSRYLVTSKNHNVLSIQSASIISANIRSNNSVIHVIDKVLFYHKATLVDIIDNDPRFQMVSYISRNTTIRSLLNSNFLYTLFLPKTSVLLSSGINFSTMGVKDRDHFLRSHVYGPGVLYLNNFATGIVQRLKMSTLKGENISARRIDENTLRINNDVLIMEGDILAKNGVIHLAEGILV